MWKPFHEVLEPQPQPLCTMETFVVEVCVNQDFGKVPKCVPTAVGVTT
jgi:hypothetical protein